MKNIIEELNVLGFGVRDLYELMNYKNYASAIPLLQNALQINKNLNVDEKELIVRCLSRIFAKSPEISKLLIEEFYKEEDRSYRWAIGNAMCFVLTKDYLNDIFEIINNEKFLTTRQMFVLAISKFKTIEVENLLINLLKNNDLTSHALIGVRKMNLKRAIEYVEPYLEDKRPLVKREAKRTIVKLSV